MKEICRDLKDEHVALDIIVADIDEADWNRPTPAEGWAIRDEISHLAYFDDRAKLAANNPEAFTEHINEVMKDLEGFRGQDLKTGRSMTARELLAWCFAQRNEGEDCSLDQALVAFSAHPAQPWLDELRYRKHSNPRHALEAALDALPLNREKVRKPTGASDEDLRRFQRPSRWSPLDEID